MLLSTPSQGSTTAATERQGRAERCGKGQVWNRLESRQRALSPRGPGVYRDSEGERCSNPRRGRNEVWGRKVHRGAGSPNPGRGGRKGGRRPRRPAAQGRRPGRRTRGSTVQGAHRQPPARRGRRHWGPQDGQGAVAQPTASRWAARRGARSPSPGERWGRRQRTQEPAAAQPKAPEVKGRDRNRLTNRKLDLNRKRAGDGTAVLLVFLRVVMPGSCSQDFLLVTVEPGLSETDPCADARTSGWLTAFACAAHAPVSRVRARRCFRARVRSRVLFRRV